MNKKQLRLRAKFCDQINRQVIALIYLMLLRWSCFGYMQIRFQTTSGETGELIYRFESSKFLHCLVYTHIVHRKKSWTGHYGTSAETIYNA